jgi:hypothetical protein
MRIRVIACVLSAVACSKDKPAPSNEPPGTVSAPLAASAELTEAEQARAAAIVGELKQTLVGALTSALGQGAPAAIDACHGMAPALAAALSKDGIRVGRATRKPRDPANEAAGWQADALAHFERMHEGKQPLAGASFTRRLDDGRGAYAEPLVIQELCVTCHGDSLATDVQAILAEKYPRDRATGYAVGDLRGVAWVELPPAK